MNPCLRLKYQTKESHGFVNRKYSFATFVKVKPLPCIEKRGRGVWLCLWCLVAVKGGGAVVCTSSVCCSLSVHEGLVTTILGEQHTPWTSVSSSLMSVNYLKGFEGKDFSRAGVRCCIKRLVSEVHGSAGAKEIYVTLIPLACMEVGMWCSVK